MPRIANTFIIRIILYVSNGLIIFRPQFQIRKLLKEEGAKCACTDFQRLKLFQYADMNQQTVVYLSVNNNMTYQIVRR